jgi:hypothetical protein
MRAFHLMAKTSKHRGVTIIRSSGTVYYHAVAYARGRKHAAGLWPTERQAALARDRVVLYLKLDYPLNFPGLARKFGRASPEQMKREAHRLTNQRRLERSLAQARHVGVQRTRSGMFMATIGSKDGVIELGTWPTEREAVLARDRALLHCRLDLPLSLPRAAARLGPMSPESLREQATRARRSATDARYLGVTWSSQFQAWVVYDGRGPVTSYRNAQAAARAADRLVLSGSCRRPLNFPGKKGLEPATRREIQAEAGELRKAAARRTSRYLGVHHRVKTSDAGWVAHVKVGGRQRFLGTWRSEEEAALAYDRGALRYLGPNARLNFPDRAAELAPADAATLALEARAKLKKTTSSRYRGVSWSDHHGSWVAGIVSQGAVLRLGSFAEEEDAAVAYDEAALKLHERKAVVNFHPDTGELLACPTPIAHLKRADRPRRRRPRG